GARSCGDRHGRTVCADPPGGQRRTPRPPRRRAAPIPRPFLDGFALPDSAEFDAWASQERQVWERRYLDALAVLVERHAAAGAYPPAIDAAQQALAIDELAEDMHRRLITLYAAAGNRTAA